MSALVIIFILVGLVINALGVVAFYYGLWKGMPQQIKGIWTNASRDTRRDLVKVWMFMAVLAVVLATLLIVSPFGARDTPIFVFGGAGVCLFLWLNGYVISLIRQNRRTK
jgi:hypothetical protein